MSDAFLAVIVVQRALRVRWHVYRYFGGALFVDAQGRAKQEGQVCGGWSGGGWSEGGSPCHT